MLVGVVAGTCALLPTIVEHHVRAKLVARGFPDADLEVSSMGLRHLSLENVHLADGLDLGSVELDRGVSLLWSDVRDVSIKHATVTDVALARAVQQPRRGKGSGRAAFRTAHVADSTLVVKGASKTVAGTASALSSSFDIKVTVRDPSKDGWSVQGRGRLVVGDDVTLENGHLDVVIPRESLGSTTIHDATASLEISGNLSALEVQGTGELRTDRVQLGPVDVANVFIPFSFSQDHLHLRSGTASIYGGQLALDPLMVRTNSAKVSLRGRGLQLSRMLTPTKRVTGAGVLDGSATLTIDKQGWQIVHVEVHARDKGSIRVADPDLQRAVAKQDSPFAVQQKIANALADFRFDHLSANLAAPGDAAELTVATRGRGRINKQELDISIAVHSARDAIARFLGGSP